MENEYRVLTHLQENETTTQRTISSRTGLSLGAVNLLLKRMMRKGLIKIEKLNPRTVRYILTPKGIQEKSRLSYRYLRESYRQLLRIRRALDHLMAENELLPGCGPVTLCGPDDEVREILAHYLGEKERPYRSCSEVSGTNRESAGPLSGLVLTWREEEERALDGQAGMVNIMKLI